MRMTRPKETDKYFTEIERILCSYDENISTIKITHNDTKRVLKNIKDL